LSYDTVVMTSQRVSAVEAMRGKGREIDALLADPIDFPQLLDDSEGLEAAA
jgi:hypothetical protein